MKHYYSAIDKELYNKLVEKGMPQLLETYAEVFDWLMSEKNLCVWFLPTWDSPSDSHLNYEYRITQMIVPFKEHTDNVSYSWHEAADAAIEKALTLI